MRKASSLVEQALADLESIGATIVDPGPGGDLFQACIDRYAPQYYNQAFTRAYPEIFPVDAGGEPIGDHIATLLDMEREPERGSRRLDPSRSRTVSAPWARGRYMMNRYLLERGDANIRSQADLIERGAFYMDSNFPDRRAILERSEGATVLDTSLRLQNRFALRLIVMQCMQEVNSTQWRTRPPACRRAS